MSYHFKSKSCFFINIYFHQTQSDRANRYNYNKGDYYPMQNDLLDIDWEAELRDEHTQQIWDILENKINGLIEKHIPKKKYTTSKSPPWYDREIGKLSKDKKKAWRTYKNSPSPDHWVNYTRHRNKLSHEIEAAKEKYENSIAARVKENPKHFWKYVNSKTKSRGKNS